MELTLQPLAKNCRVSGQAFAEGERVICRLVREDDGTIARHDVLASVDAAYVRPEFVFCTWTVSYKERQPEANAGRMLKLTAETLFLNLADPATEADPANTPLVQFLALLLERKKILRPRGTTSGGQRQIFEHARTHQIYEVAAGVLDEAFFVNIQGQLDVLLGGEKRAETLQE